MTNLVKRLITRPSIFSVSLNLKVVGFISYHYKQLILNKVGFYDLKPNIPSTNCLQKIEDQILDENDF